VKNSLSWMKKLSTLSWAREPFRVGNVVVATNGEAILAVRCGKNIPFPTNSLAAQRSAKFLKPSAAQKTQSLPELKKFLKRTAFNAMPSYGHLFGVQCDLSLVWRFIKHVDGNKFSVRKANAMGIKNCMLIFDAEKWKFTVMGVRPGTVISSHTFPIKAKP
jgi:hypothetical protein